MSKYYKLIFHLVTLEEGILGTKAVLTFFNVNSPNAIEIAHLFTFN